MSSLSSEQNLIDAAIPVHNYEDNESVAKMIIRINPLLLVTRISVVREMCFPSE